MSLPTLRIETSDFEILIRADLLSVQYSQKNETGHIKICQATMHKISNQEITHDHTELIQQNYGNLMRSGISKT